VPDLRERVVLGEDGDPPASRLAGARDERRRHPVGAALDTVGAPFDEVADPPRGPRLFVAELGVGVDLVGELAKSGALGVHGEIDGPCDLGGQRHPLDMACRDVASQ
jgi:hypothetical protein